VENARDLSKQDYIPLTIRHYLKNLPKLADQFFTSTDAYKEKTKQRVYLKDIDCPRVWEEKLKDHIPPFLFYWNDSTGDVGGPGAIDERGRLGKGIAVGGDLMSMLPEAMRAENLMCYIGHEGTYTPAHREMCASLGHNIMVDASESFDENGAPVKPGSSIWFMTESKDREVVAEYWLSVLGHDIEVENHFAQVAAWQRAPFKVYVVEQKAGDFILIPPLAPHQVWNRGTRTMKVAWNRTTVETLELAFKEALPKARMVCRDEQYKNKAIVYYTMINYSNALKIARAIVIQNPLQHNFIYGSKKVRQVQKDFKRLFNMFKDIMLSEMFKPDTREHCEFVAFDSTVTCSYCRGNIFNRFLTCKNCTHAFNPDVEEPYDVCMECYVMGRCCGCQSGYKWSEQFKWKDLVARYEEWRQQIIEIDDGMTPNTPLNLKEERARFPKRTIAQICQEALKLRPFIDPNKPRPPPEESEEEIEVDEHGYPKKIRKKHSRDWYENQKSCHVCLKRHPKWMMAHCTMCERGWCYGSLWRAHELMPQQVMEDPQWECPHCRKVCSTGACRKDPRQHPYEPKHTLLGHDTKKVADPRSQEVLVDFSTSNLNWIKETSQTEAPNSKRLLHKRSQADIAKQFDPTLDEEHYAEDVDEGVVMDGPAEVGHPAIQYEPIDPNLDPALVGGDTVLQNGSANPTLYDPAPHWNAVNNDDPMMLDPAMSGQHRNSLYPDPMEETNGFVAPTTVMFQPPDQQLDDGSVPFVAETTNKRKRQSDVQPIKLVTSKKRKVAGENADAEDSRSKPAALTKASKQYQAEQEKKRLEEAIKQGRYVQIYGAIRGKSKVVKVRIDGDKLAAIVARSRAKAKAKASAGLAQRATASAQAPTGETSALLRSDLAPPKQRGPVRPQAQKALQIRYRVEDDGDFHLNGPQDPEARKPQKQFEEITLESDEEPEVMPSTSTARRRRRKTDEDGLAELPENFREGALRTERQKQKDRERAQKRKEEAERRKTLPAKLSALDSSPFRPQPDTRKPQAMKAPRIRPAGVRASTGNTDVDEMDAEPSSTTVIEDQPAPVANIAGPSKKASAVAAHEIARLAMLEEENRLAKMEAVAMVGDLVDEFATDGEGDDENQGDAAAGASSIVKAKLSGNTNGAAKPKAKPKGGSKKLSPGELRKLGKNIKVSAAKPSAVSLSKAVQEISSESESSEGESSDVEVPSKPPPKKVVARKSMEARVPINRIRGRGKGRPPGRKSVH
jgi:JmjC domain, hydroxylase/Zinc-finger domain of monoamine-oxidase A repressor R1